MMSVDIFVGILSLCVSCISLGIAIVMANRRH